MGQIQPTARAPRTVHKGDMDYIDGPSIDSIDTDSIDALIAASAHSVRADYLRLARMSVLRDAISVCYKQYGPNNPVKCRPLYIEYLRRLEEGGRTKVNIEELHPQVGGKEGKGEDKAEE